MAAGAFKGTQQGPQTPSKRNHTEEVERPLVGPRNKVEVEVNGKACKALIDSGSQITSITHNYWQIVLKQSSYDCINKTCQELFINTSHNVIQMEI